MMSPIRICRILLTGVTLLCTLGVLPPQSRATPPDPQPAPWHRGDIMPAPASVPRGADAAILALPYKLAVYYVLPAGISFDQAVRDRLVDASLDIQAWYQVATGGLTWEWAFSGIVEVYHGRETRGYYAANGNWWGSLLPEMSDAGLPIWQPGVVTVLWAQGAGWWAGGAQGCEGDCGMVLLGVELFPQFNNPQWSGGQCPDPTGLGVDAWPCTPAGAYAHELGHTLGLSHPYDDPSTAPYAFHSLMQTHWNYPDEARGEESPWGFLRSERQQIQGNAFMKPDIALRQRYQDLDIVVNLPPAGAGPAAAFDVALIDNRATFANRSQGAVRYYWTFGDFAGSNESSPAHIYPGLGAYTVRLWASDTAATLSETSRQVQVLTLSPTTPQVYLPLVIRSR